MNFQFKNTSDSAHFPYILQRNVYVHNDLFLIADIIFEQERMIMDTYQEQCHHIFFTFLKLFLGHSNFNALPPIFQFSPLKMKYSPISFIAIRSGKVRSLIQAVILFGPTDLLIIKAVVRFVLFYLTAFGSEIFSKQ